MEQDTSGRAQTTEGSATVENQATTTEQQKKDSVAYDTHRRLLAEKKDVQEKFNLLQEQLQTLQQEKLSAEGNKEELIKTLQKQVDDWKGKTSKATEFFKWHVVSNTVERKAKEVGCIDTKKLVQLLDLSSVEPDVDKGFSLEEEQIDALLENAKKEMPYFFKAQNIKVNDVVPRTINGKPHNEMSRDELMAAIREHKR